MKGESMSEDIVPRLREWAAVDKHSQLNPFHEAADEIERLREEIAGYEAMKEGVAVRIADLDRLTWLSLHKLRIIGGNNSIFIEHKPSETDLRKEIDEAMNKEQQ